MHDDVQKFVQSCPTCQACKSRRPRHDAIEGLKPTRINEIVSMDFIGPLPPGRFGARYIVTLTDIFSRYSEATIAHRKSISCLLACLRKWIDHVGPMEELFGDRDPVYRSHVLRQFCSDNMFNLTLTARYMHKSNGLNERFNQTLCQRIRCLLYDSGGFWTDHLDTALQIYNTSRHEVTQIAPSILLSGISLTGRPLSDTERWHVEKRALENTREAQAKWQETDAARVHGTTLSLGQYVWVFDAPRAESLSRKFDPYWLGPYQLIARHSQVLWSVKRGRSHWGPLHSDHLKLYVGSSGSVSC